MSTTTSFLTAYQPKNETTTYSSQTLFKKRSNDKSCKNELSEITTREKEVLHLIAYEHSSKEIAKKLFVSYETINSHRKNMMDKLGVKNTAGLVRMAFQKNILKL